MSPSALLLAQLIVILLVARLCSWILAYLGQPGVVGEMLAGLLLGPVIFGALLPDLHAALFPIASLDALSSLSMLGLVLFMFTVGLETQPQLGAQFRASGLVGILSVLAPVLLGLAITPWLYEDLAPPGVGYWPFALFVAAALSVTAFPVMARILKDRGLTQTRLGQLSLNAAAAVDVFAWVLLAGANSVSGPDRAMRSRWRTDCGSLGGIDRGAAHFGTRNRRFASARRVWRILVRSGASPR
jgi:Kef-type K+ transport system membrane component KefB